MSTGKDVFIAMDLMEGQRVKLTRIARGLRQVDVASQARVTVADVVCIEKDRYLKRTRKEKIFKALGLEMEEECAIHQKRT